MPSKHSPGYNRWFQGIAREATRRLIAAHRDEYDNLVDDLKQRHPRPVHHR